jgi:hypothetical protein
MGKGTRLQDLTDESRLNFLRHSLLDSAKTMAMDIPATLI